MDVALSIEKLLPAAEYFGSTSANTPEALAKLEWRDKRRGKPTWEELEIAWAELQKPSAQELEAQFTTMVTDRLNAFAAEKQYDSITSARLARLAHSFEQDGWTANAAYDVTWKAAIELIPQIGDGTLTPEEALEQLPALAWDEEADDAQAEMENHHD